MESTVASGVSVSKNIVSPPANCSLGMFEPTIDDATRHAWAETSRLASGDVEPDAILAGRSVNECREFSGTLNGS